MEAVMAAERALGLDPRDVSDQNLGYGIASRHPNAGLRFIEVKGRVDGADTVTVTQNEIRCALNKPESLILALVSVSNGFAGKPRYIRQPFR
jgi:Protein NO VEIN, C-terminal